MDHLPISFESSSCKDGQKNSMQNVMVKVVLANRSPHKKEEAPLRGAFLRRAWRSKPDLGSDSQHKNFNNKLFKKSKTKSRLKKQYSFSCVQVRAPSFVSRLSGTKSSRPSPLGSSACQAEDSLGA